MLKWLGVSNDRNPSEDGIKDSENKNEDPQVLDVCDKPKDDMKLSEVIPTENVKEAASKIGNYLYNFASVATNTASKLKESVNVHLDKTIIGEFNRENEKFLQEKQARRIGDGVPPWTGYHEESTMRRQILALSSDERNFLRSPPSGVDFSFELDLKMPVAMAALEEDKALEEMRFKLVPKRISEENFWRNYFYRVSLIKQSTQLSSMADQELRRSPHTSSTESLNKGTDKVDAQAAIQEEPVDITGSPSQENPLSHEFISDSFQIDGGLSEEERNQMLGTADDSSSLSANPGEGNAKDEWELDKELQEEIESFELVNENTGEDDGNWEKEIEDMLEMESS